MEAIRKIIETKITLEQWNDIYRSSLPLPQIYLEQNSNDLKILHFMRRGRRLRRQTSPWKRHSAEDK